MENNAFRKINVIINRTCNRRCDYCFARNHLRKKGPPREISLSDFKKAILFIIRSRVPVCGISGGEPTLHSRFKALIAFASKFKKLSLHIYTNGIFPKEIAELLAGYGPKISYLWNIADKRSYSSPEWSKLNENLKLLTPFKTSAFGMTFHKTNQGLKIFKNLSLKYKPVQLRFCAAHPNVPMKENDVWTRTEDSKRLLLRYIAFAKTIKIHSVFDCGIVPCVISYRQAKILERSGIFLKGCEDIASIDPGLNVFHCYQSSNPNEVGNLKKFSRAADVKRFLFNIRQRYGNVFLFEKCIKCRQACDLGCLAERKNIVHGYKDWLKKTRYPSR
ncbi:MAG: radical SAM protein [Pseudomonadota bacterium]